MLDPDYILRLGEGAEETASRLHTDILRLVVRRILLRLQRREDYLLTAVDKWQLETLQEAGFLREELEREIAAATGRQVTEIKRAFEEAGVKTIAWDNAVYRAAGLSPAPLLKSPQLLALLDRGYRRTLGEWRNYTGTTAAAAQRLFIQVCDRAYTQVAAGVLSYTQAVAEAVERVAGSGVVVRYPSGWQDTIETATLRAVRTGVAQACADMTGARMEELDWDTVLTSAHLGARYGDGGENLTNHAWWQGRFFSRSGRDIRFPPLSVCGLGDVQGLCGANCRHSMGPGDGENNPYEGYDSEENRRRYDLEQRQRQLERRIRATKREVQGWRAAVEAADPETRPALEEKYQKKARLLQKQNQEYNRFCEENGLKPLRDRLKVAGWDRGQAAGAAAAARNVRANRLKDPVSDGIMRSPSLGYIQVTEEAVAKIAPVSGGILDEKTARILQESHRELLRTVKDAPLGTEAAQYCDMSGRLLVRYLGEPGKAAISGTSVPVPHIASHTHPDGEIFSLQDIRKFIKNGDTIVMAAVGNNGSVYCLAKTKAYDPAGFIQEYLQIVDELPERLTTIDQVDQYVKKIEAFLKGAERYGVAFEQKGTEEV